MKVLPFTLPGAYKLKAGQQPATSDVDTGGYDVLVGGIGFRLATDTQFPYLRSTEPTTVRRFDNSAEPGEQTLSPLPWVKSQSSFHAGAGQQNLEAPFTAFQYQQEQIAHLRYDTSLGVDPWTPGKVQRLPDTTFSSFGFDVKCVITATVNGVDYAVVGGVRSLYLITWNSGPDSAPTVTLIDMSAAVYGGINNITVESLTTDGVNYYGLVALTAAGSTPGVLTYVIAGAVGSTAAPIPIYDVAGTTGAAIRTNLCTNPSLEVSTAGYSITGGTSVALSQSATWSDTGSQSGYMYCPGQGRILAGSYVPTVVSTTFATTVGTQYTVSAMVRADTGSGSSPITLSAGGSTSVQAPADGSPHRLSTTFTATATTTTVTLQSVFATHNLGDLSGYNNGTSAYFDSLLFETAPSGTYFDGNTASCVWTGTAGLSTSQTTNNAPITTPGIVGWVKERLIAGVGNRVYELSSVAGAHTALPTPKYSHPVTSYLFSAISESPVSILMAGYVGGTSTLMKFTLDTSGNTPTLGGGATIATMPPGERIQTVAAYLGSYVALGTTAGVRVGTFDTYTGNLTYGPLSLKTTAPVLTIAGRDRFIFAGYTNQQPDGTTGLARVDLSQPVDNSGRLAWAPDLRPPTSAPTGQGTVYAVAVLPLSNRLFFVTSEGLHVEGNGPGSDGSAWLRTSRIRYDTEELKLFKAGRMHGTLDQGTITVTGLTRYGGSVNLGTFGFITGTTDPGEFGLPTGLQPWIQLQFQLNGSAVVLNSYSAKALPAPTRQRVITLTVNCFREEVDRFGLSVTDPLYPRERYAKLKALESSGNELRFVEFTILGPVATLVVIDQLEYHSFSRPSIDDDFGGYITLKLRETVGS